MPRRPRLNLPPAPMHVIQRGNNRQATFFADEDYRFYLECLGDTARRYACRIDAYVPRRATCTCSPAPRRPTPCRG